MIQFIQATPELQLHTNHISLVRENSILQTLWSHPLDREFYRGPLSLPEVVPGIHILRETEVCYLDYKVGINPASQTMYESSYLSDNHSNKGYSFSDQFS